MRVLGVLVTNFSTTRLIKCHLLVEVILIAAEFYELHLGSLTRVKDRDVFTEGRLFFVSDFLGV